MTKLQVLWTADTTRKGAEHAEQHATNEERKDILQWSVTPNPTNQSIKQEAPLSDNDGGLQTRTNSTK